MTEQLQDLEQAGAACLRDAANKLGGYYPIDYVAAAKLIEAANTFRREADRLRSLSDAK